MPSDITLESSAGVGPNVACSRKRDASPLVVSITTRGIGAGVVGAVGVALGSVGVEPVGPGVDVVGVGVEDEDADEPPPPPPPHALKPIVIVMSAVHMIL